LALVLMDCHMPGMDGYETTRRIRRYEADLDLPRIPVIAISAATDAVHLYRCIECGMDNVLHKPLRPGALLSMLDLWLDLRPAKPFVARGVADGAGFDMFKSYRTSFEEDVLELKTAVAQDDVERVAYLAHRIRGAALMAQARGVAREACRVETMTQAADPQGAAEALVALQAEIRHWAVMPRH
jgi:two-component system sensor histidine kinase EvgS